LQKKNPNNPKNILGTTQKTNAYLLVLQSQALLKGTKESQLLWLLRKLNVLISASLDWNLGHQKSSDRL